MGEGSPGGLTLLMDNNIQIDYPAPLKALKEVALELKLNQDVLDRLESFPENKSELDIAQIDELLSIAEMLFDELKDYDSKAKKQNSDWAREVTTKVQRFIIREKRKKTGKSDWTIKRNQKIIDECYRLEKEGLKSKIIYKRVAKNYPELSEHSIKKIRLSPDSPTPTELKPKNK